MLLDPAPWVLQLQGSTGLPGRLPWPSLMEIQPGGCPELGYECLPEDGDAMPSGDQTHSRAH